MLWIVPGQEIAFPMARPRPIFNRYWSLTDRDEILDLSPSIAMRPVYFDRRIVRFDRALGSASCFRQSWLAAERVHAADLVLGREGQADAA